MNGVTVKRLFFLYWNPLWGNDSTEIPPENTEMENVGR